MKTIVFYVFIIISIISKVHCDLPFKRVYVEPSLEVLSKDLSLRITNGREATPHSIPYQARLAILSSGIGGWMCSGTLITPIHVLTAAHCLDSAAGVIAYLGVHNAQQLEDSQVTGFSRELIMHENYNETSISNDIGIIVLEEPMLLNENISTVVLPTRQDDTDFEGENARISGWGLVSGTGSSSEVLLEANVTVISNTQCKRVFDIVTDSQLCTLGSRGEGTCDGDSGGPLVAGNVQIGITSFGAAGCPDGVPSAYTRITSYLDWIEKHTGLIL